MTTSIRLREASAADSASVFAMHREAFESYVVALRGEWNDAAELEQHAERYARQRCRIVVADGADVGYISTATYPDGRDRYPPGMYLHQLMIRPAFQSKGLGAICLAQVMEEARAEGLPLHLRVLRVNPRALSFYLARGGWVVGESDTHIALRML